MAKHTKEVTSIRDCTEFVPSSKTQVEPPNSEPADPVHESVLLIAVGSDLAIELIIKTLHKLRFAEATAWSKLQIEPKSGRSVQVLKKWIRL